MGPSHGQRRVGEGARNSPGRPWRRDSQVDLGHLPVEPGGEGRQAGRPEEHQGHGDSVRRKGPRRPARREARGVRGVDGRTREPEGRMGERRRPQGQSVVASRPEGLAHRQDIQPRLRLRQGVPPDGEQPGAEEPPGRPSLPRGRRKILAAHERPGQAAHACHVLQGLLLCPEPALRRPRRRLGGRDVHPRQGGARRPPGRPGRRRRLRNRGFRNTCFGSSAEPRRPEDRNQPAGLQGQARCPVRRLQRGLPRRHGDERLRAGKRAHGEAEEVLLGHRLRRRRAAAPPHDPRPHRHARHVRQGPDRRAARGDRGDARDGDGDRGPAERVGAVRRPAPPRRGRPGQGVHPGERLQRGAAGAPGGRGVDAGRRGRRRDRGR